MSEWDDLNGKITILATSHSELRERVDSLTTTVNEHSVIINKMSQTQKDVREMLEVFTSVKGGMVVLGWLGTFAKWVWPIIAIGIAVWIYIKTGRWQLND